jgi:hypothetical protein
MPIVFKKKTPEPKPTVNMVAQEAPQSGVHKPKMANTVAAAPAVLMAEELLKLQASLKQLDVANINKRIAELKSELVEQANLGDPKAPLTLLTAWGTVEVTAPSTMTIIDDNQKVIDHINEKFGTDALMSILKIGITDLKKFVSEAELSDFTHTEAGSRSVKVTLAP